MSRLSAIVGASMVVHAALALGVGAIRTHKPRAQAQAISVHESKKKKPEPPRPADPPTPPPEPPRAEARAQPRAKAAPPKAPAPQAQPAPAQAAPQAGPQLAGLPDFGLSMSGGTGSGGMAIPSGTTGGAGPAEPQAQAPQKAKTLSAQAPRPGSGDDCDEPVSKPRPKSVPQPAYTASARDAGVSGKVRLELRLDAQGNVAQVTLKQGLGHGLDEAALDAARRAKFDPATRCGKPVATTFTLSLRFTL